MEEKRKGRKPSEEIEFVAYKLIGDEEYEVHTFSNLAELNRFFGRSERNRVPSNHIMVPMPSGFEDEDWRLFKGKEKISYIQAVIERRI